MVAACHALGIVSTLALLVGVAGAFVEAARFALGACGSESLGMPNPNDIDRDRAMSLRGKE